MIRALRALRYSSKAGPLEQLVAPPYDVLSTEDRNRLASESPFNIVHLTLPESEMGDRSKFVKYARSASRLEQWRDEGTLELEQRPTFYRYRQTFTIPGSREPIERQSLIALIQVVPYDRGIVLPHEQTFPKHKEDRLRILEATRAHLECIYGLYEDDGGAIYSAIDQAPAQTLIDVTTEDGVRHLIEGIDDPRTVDQLSQMIAPKKVWIADGHHRYETACTFREMKGETSGEVPEDFMMMALSSISDPGLVLLPTHRMVKRLGMSREELAEKAAAYFSIESVPNESLLGRLESLDTIAFGIVWPGGQGELWVAKDPTALLAATNGQGSDDLRALDVSILHDVIFSELMGLTGNDFFDYTRDPDEAIASVDQGYAAAFLMNPPTVDDMRRIALGGEKMPQKSTYYYPKILSGLLVWSLNDFEPAGNNQAVGS